ncbi:hypothetical protein HerbRD11066_67240 [Herbidospora sp. RD11066]
MVCVRGWPRTTPVACGLVGQEQSAGFLVLPPESTFGGGPALRVAYALPFESTCFAAWA